MTKKQRAQVVELLRCAADMQYAIRAVADIYIGTSDAVREWAVDAWRDSGVLLDDYRRSLLEAASRVEEESYP